MKNIIATLCLIFLIITSSITFASSPYSIEICTSEDAILFNSGLSDGEVPPEVTIFDYIPVRLISFFLDLVRAQKGCF